jgi:hypothetical protein
MLKFKIMRALKSITTLVLLMLCLASFSQATQPATKTNVYYVQATHTPEECLNMLVDLKSKGDAYLSKFEFGCMSGNHTGYAFLEGTSEANVKQMMPKDIQATAKIQKVDKFTADQIEKLHKEKMSAETKK